MRAVQERQRAEKAARLGKPPTIQVDGSKAGSKQASASTSVPAGRRPDAAGAQLLPSTPSSAGGAAGSFAASTSPGNAGGMAMAAAALAGAKKEKKLASVVPMQMQMDTTQGRAKMQKSQVLGARG